MVKSSEAPSLTYLLIGPGRLVLLLLQKDAKTGKEELISQPFCKISKTNATCGIVNIKYAALHFNSRGIVRYDKNKTAIAVNC